MGISYSFMLYRHVHVDASSAQRAMGVPAWFQHPLTRPVGCSSLIDTHLPRSLLITVSDGKLDHATYRDLSLQIRRGHATRKRDLEEVLADQRAQRVDEQIAAKSSACVEPQRAAERKCLICSFQGESTLNPHCAVTKVLGLCSSCTILILLQQWLPPPQPPPPPPPSPPPPPRAPSPR